MKKFQKGFVVPLVIAIAIILIVAGAYAIWKNKASDAPYTSNDMAVESASGWKTYSNADFSIQYPPGYIVVSRDWNETNRQEQIITFTPPAGSADYGNEFDLNAVRKTPDTLDSFVKSFTGANTTIQRDSMQIDGTSVTKISVIRNGDGNVHITHLVFQKGNTIYEIIGKGSSSAFYSDTASLFKAFYGSFKTINL